MKKVEKTWKDLKIEEELCRRLDEELYIPCKKDFGSFGHRKELFKGVIEEELKKPKNEAIKQFKDLWNHRMRIIDVGGIPQDREQRIDVGGIPQDREQRILQSIDAQMTWILQFFDITEDDLKE